MHNYSILTLITAGFVTIAMMTTCMFGLVVMSYYINNIKFHFKSFWKEVKRNAIPLQMQKEVKWLL